MVIRASVLMFLLTISTTRCLSESISNIPLADVGTIDAYNMLEEEKQLNEVAKEVENEDETDDSVSENPEDELEQFSSHSTEEKNEEDTQSDNENGNINDENSTEKRLIDLGISKSDLQRVITEAEEEVKRDVPKIPDESPETSSSMTYQVRHYRAKYDPKSKERTQQALITERVMERLAKKLRFSNDEAAAKLTGLQIKKRVNDGNCRNITCDKNKPYRELDGMCNNLKNPCWGAVNIPFRRLLKPDYADKRRKPRESKDKNNPLPNPRLFSFNVFKGNSNPSRSLTHMTMIWGQFIDHDIALSAHRDEDCPKKQQSCTSGPNRGECFGVPVPPSDPHFLKNGVKCLHVIRSAPAGATTCDCVSTLGHREQSNTLTSFIDGSQVYGVNINTLKSLRLPGSSLLRYQGTANLLPREKPGSNGFCRTDCGKPCFKAGDGRVNENQGLASMHTLFVREHNRIARELTRRKLSWTINKVFEETRKIIGAQIQHITYNEFLPIILDSQTRRQNGLVLSRSGFYTGYKERIDPSIINSFATAAYRFGHSLVQNIFSRPGKLPIPTKSFFNPCPVYKGTDSIFGGLATDPAQKVDRFFSSALTQSLVVGPDVVIDLPAINIQRGRDHGLPGYNEFRRRCGLNKASTFDGFRGQMSKFNRDKLAKYYNHVDDIDLYAGGIMEKPMRGGVLGPTFTCLVANQFVKLRNGDRFWYENGDHTTGFTAPQLAEIRKVSLARLICDHNRLLRAGKIQRKVMEISGKHQMIPCHKLPKMDLRAW